MKKLCGIDESTGRGMSEPADETGSFIFSMVGRMILSMSSSDQLNSAIRRRAPGTERSTERPEDTSPRSILFFSSQSRYG